MRRYLPTRICTSPGGRPSASTRPSSCPGAATGVWRFGRCPQPLPTGTRWTAPEDAVWAPLPSFTPLPEAVEEPELLALSAALPKSRYAFWSGQGLWYCSCGGVNRESETACHRCGCRREEAQRLASAHGSARCAGSRQRSRSAWPERMPGAGRRPRPGRRPPSSSWPGSGPAFTGARPLRRRLRKRRRLCPTGSLERRAHRKSGRFSCRLPGRAPANLWRRRPEGKLLLPGRRRPIPAEGGRKPGDRRSGGPAGGGVLFPIPAAGGY